MSKQAFVRSVVVSLCLPLAAAALGAQLFEDDLSVTFGSASTPDNIGWAAPVGPLNERPTQCDTVTDAPLCAAHSGTKSLRFNFPGATPSASRQHVDLQPPVFPMPPNTGMGEVWLEWYQLFPDATAPVAWTHTDLPTADDSNQFLFLTGPGVNVEAWLQLSSPTTEIVKVKNLTTGITLADDEGAGLLGSLGTWRRVRWHAKTGLTNGILNHWIDNTQGLDNSGIPFLTSASRFTDAQIMGEANSGYGADSKTYLDDLYVANRPPVSIVLMLDTSGSMAGTTAAGGLTKIDALKKAAGVFLDVIPPYAGPRDKVGIVTFDTAAEMLTSTGAVTTMANQVLVGAKTAANTAALKNNVVAGLAASGATSIGDGLLKSRAVLVADGNAHQVVLLFTDGKQNTAPMVDAMSLAPGFNTGGFTIGGGATKIPPDPPGAFHADKHMQVCSISVGIGTAVDHAFNSTLSQCNDADYLPRDAFSSDFVCPPMDPMCTNLVALFIANLQAAVFGDKVETAAIEANGTRFLVNDHDTRLSLVLLWSDPNVRSEALRVTLRSPGPTPVDVGAEPFTTHGNGYQVISFPMPLADRRIAQFAGEWGLSVEAPQTPSFQYSLLVMNDNQTIATGYRFVGNDFGTGDDVPIEVTLTQAGLPIPNATVIAAVQAPNDGVGNVLSTSPTPRGDVNTRGDVLSPAQQKLELLLASPEILARLGPNARPDVILRDPDLDGTYTGTYRGTTIPGTYQFTFLVEGMTPENGRFTRELKQSLSIRSKPAAGSSAIKVRSVDGRGFNSIVTFTPKDRFGNFLGPGFADQIAIAGNGTLVDQPIDNLDGSYELHVAITPPSARPDIRIVIGPDTLDVRRRFPWWLLFLLLIPVVAVYLWRAR